MTIEINNIDKEIVNAINNKYKQKCNKIWHLHKLGYGSGKIKKMLMVSYQHINNEIDRFSYRKMPREKFDNKFLSEHKNKYKNKIN